jgi:hypothetical protein
MRVFAQKGVFLCVVFLLGCTPELTFEEPTSGMDIQNEDIGVVSDVFAGDVVDSLDVEQAVDSTVAGDTVDAIMWNDVQDVAFLIEVVSAGDTTAPSDVFDGGNVQDAQEDVVGNTDVLVLYDGGVIPESDVAVEEDVPAPPCPPCDATCGDPCEGYPIRFNEVTSKGQKEIEIHNTTAFTWYLYGFSLGHGQSMNDDEEVFEFDQEDVLAPGEYFVIKKDNGHGLNLHDRDTLKLRSPDGELLSFVSWDRKKANHSYCRIPDVSGVFQECTEKTFGFPNQSN